MSKRTEQQKPIIPIQSGSTTVRHCPVTQASTGVIKLPTTLISEIAGAVQHHLEWALLLYGEFESDTVAKVTRWKIPKQDRTRGDVQIAPHDMPHDLIGVMHSHHNMGAFWSSTDLNELNPGYPTSIVVAQYKALTSPRPETQHELTERLFGFCFKAEGKIPLPCRKLGWCDWEVTPYDAEDGGEFSEWNYAGEIVQPDNHVVSLGGCSSHEVEFVEGFKQLKVAECGVRTEPVQAIEWWGATEELMTWLLKQDQTDKQSLVKAARKDREKNYGTLINPLHNLDSVRYYKALTENEAFNEQNVQQFVQWLDSRAGTLNRKLIVGLNVPKTTTDQQYLSSLCQRLVKQCLNNSSWLTTEDFAFDLRHWFAPILEDVTNPWQTTMQYVPSRIIHALHEPHSAERICDFLTELSTLSAMRDNNNPESLRGFTF